MTDKPKLRNLTVPKVRDSNVNGGKEPPLSWMDIEWKAAKKRVRNLRQRIYRATKEGNWRKIKSLQKLMLRSYSNLLTTQIATNFTTAITFISNYS